MASAKMIIISDILKEACQEVYARTRGVAGTALGNRQTGKRGAGGDISRQIDLLAEKAVIQVLKRHGLDAAATTTIIGEECGIIEGKRTKEGKDSGRTSNSFVIMDAIDGTTNTSRRIPFYCCSIAFADKFKLSSVKDAAIIDLTNGDLYTASKGMGAFCNGNKIGVIGTKEGDADNSAADDSNRDIVVGMNISGIDKATIDKLSPVIARANHIRHFGSLALELCYLAKGAIDASIDLRGKVRPVDIAAAFLIVKEAGGQIYSDKGVELDIDLGIKTRFSFVATAQKTIFQELSKAGVFERA